MIQFKQQRRSRFSLLFKIAFQTESDQHVLTQEEIEEEAVFSANLKRNLSNKALVYLHKLSFDDTDTCCNGIVRYRETESSERFFVQASGNGPRGLQPRDKSDSGQISIYPDSRMEGAPIHDIVVSKGSVSNDNK